MVLFSETSSLLLKGLEINEGECAVYLLLKTRVWVVFVITYQMKNACFILQKRILFHVDVPCFNIIEKNMPKLHICLGIAM